MAPLTVISPREASMFACFVDTVVAPRPVLPPVHRTDAVHFLDRWLARAPRINRAGLRGLIWMVEIGPWALGFKGRLRRLSPADRVRYLHRIERAQLRALVKLLKGVAFLSYYGDDDVMRQIGYDADANVARGRELRASQGRP